MLVAAVIILFLFESYDLQISTALNTDIYFKPSLNLSLLEGIWYQQAKFGPMLFGDVDQCGVLQLVYQRETNQIDLNYTSTLTVDKNQTNHSGKAKYYSTNKENGFLKINWKYDPEYKQEPTSKLYVVDTNYEDFAVLASPKANKSVSGWVVTRAKNIALARDPPTIISKIVNAMQTIKEVVNEDVYLDAQINCATSKFSISDKYFSF